MTFPAPIRLATTLALGAAAALILAGCGASFESGVAAPSPAPSARVQAATTPTPSDSASSCVNPSSTPSYTLAGARTLAGNLEVKDIKIGTGATAADGDTVQVSYVGSLPNGTVFDNSANDNGGKPISLTIAAGKVIQGWVEGIPGMRVGGERELVIPPALGYGCTSPSSKIPVNSTLIFTITLVAIG
jgi:FKBP-type peptidyl-prolyl cis-trans isomerase